MQHIQRWISAVVLIPVILWVVLKGNDLSVALLVSIVAILAMWEFFKMAFNKLDTRVPQSVPFVSFAISIAMISAANYASWPGMLLMLAVNLLFLCVFSLWNFSSRPDFFEIISKQILGIIYIPVSLSLLIFIKKSDQGALWIVWLLIVVFLNDTGAFYSGKFFGRRKLAPNVSPNKTIEGSIGGFAGSVISGFISSVLFFQDLNLALAMMPCAFFIAAAGQAGDLFESAMKRISGIKDSGVILPGHGGMLDRIDGLLFAIPVMYAYQVFVL